MSIKIYHGFRCPIEKLNNALDSLRKSMTKQVTLMLEEYMLHVKPEAIGECPDHYKNIPEAAKLWERCKRSDVVIDLCREAAKSSYQNPMDVECGVNVWLHDGYAYFIPFASRFMLNKFKRPKCCEDYYYQSSADKPKNISQKEWDERYDNWNEVCIKDHNARRLYFDIVSLETEMDVCDLKDLIKANEYNLFKFSNKKEK